MGKFLSILLFLGSVTFASELTLKERLSEAKPGSYLVIEQNKTYTFLHLHDVSKGSVVIEEVSIPAANISKRAISWKEWFEKGAPGHTSWIMSQVSLKTGSFEETFSFTHQGWIDMSDSDSFFTTLLNLHFSEVPDNERRRVGLPGFNKTDIRPVWNPLLIVDGAVVANAPFHAFKARWPADGSELARKVVEIYLPISEKDSSDNTEYPLYFPYWLEVDGRFNTSKVRVVDSGIKACSPKKNMPKRPLQLYGEVKMDNSGLSLQLKSPPYYRDFFILAEENENFFGNSFPLPCQTSFEEGGIVSLFVAKEAFENLKDRGSIYRFVISPREDPNVVLSTKFSIKIS